MTQRDPDRSEPTPRRAAVIANPVAGRGRARASAEALARGLAADGWQCELLLTEGPAHAPRKLAEHAADAALVVAVGGDGTVGEVLSGLPRTARLAVLPMGTANVLALDLRLPRTVAGVLEMIRAGRSTLIDSADVNGRLSFLVTGVGFDGLVVQSVERHRKGPITRWTYVREVLRSLGAYEPPELSLEIDGRAYPGPCGWVLVSNLIGYGGFLRLSPDRVLDDGLFEVFVFAKGSLPALVGYAVRGVLRRLPGGSCTMLRARSVKIESKRAVPYQVDGDFGGTTPLCVELTGRQHRLILP